MCQAFGKIGHNITLLLPGSNKKSADLIYDYYGVTPNFKIVWQHKFAIKGRGVIYSVLGALKVRSLSPDIVYCRYLRGGFICCFLGLHLIYEVHEPIQNSIDQKLFKKLVKMKNFKRLVVLSKELKKHYTEQYNIPDKLIVVAYNGANDNLLSKNLPVVNLAKNPHNLNVGYIGHIYPGKGMEVITNIAKYCKWANFHIVGGRENDIQKWKSITEHDDNIYFYGHYKPSQIKGFQNFIEVLLLPPMQKVMVFGDKFIEQKYAPPIKLFDYMSWGKAIIASNYLSEILADGQTAILCDPLYFEEWISALTLLRTDIQMREMLGHNARSDYIKKFLWSNRAEKVLANLTF